MLGFGGQTALNCGVELAEQGVYEKYDMKVLGTPIKAIQEADNRELFRQAMIWEKLALKSLEAKVPRVLKRHLKLQMKLDIL